MRYAIGDQVTVRTSDRVRYGVIIPHTKRKDVPIGCYTVQLRSAKEPINVHLDYLQHLIGPVRPQDIVEVPKLHIPRAHTPDHENVI